MPFDAMYIFSEVYFYYQNQKGKQYQNSSVSVV